MPLLQTWEKEESRFAIWHTTETAEELRAMLPAENALYDDELQALKSSSRKLEYLATRVLLHTLCREEKIIGHQPSGKPFLTDGSFRISISHTHGYAAIAIHPNREVGIDIEYQSGRVMNITERFLSEEELTALPSHPENKRIYALLCWSAKETAFKVLGAEEVDFRKHFRIHPFTLTPHPTLTLSEYKTNERNEFHIHTIRNEHFVCTWCVSPVSTFSAR